MILTALMVKVFPLTDYGFDLNFIGKYIGWLISITGSVGMGIILFTLTLRLIVLPFDIFSKIKTKKNAAKMEEMRPELERLQKQYAHDKNLYNQKMLALQKKNGYSPLSGCLPAILSLIIFIIAINAFRTYSAVSMANEYNDIIKHYNYAVESLTVNGENADMYEMENGVLSVKNGVFYDRAEVIYPEGKGLKDVVNKDGENVFSLKIDGENKFTAEGSAYIDEIKADLGLYAGAFIKDENGIYSVDDGMAEDKNAFYAGCTGEIIKVTVNAYLEKEVTAPANENVKEAYENGDILKSSFLWVKNVWMPDVSYEHPVVSDSKNFQSKISTAATRSCSCDRTLLPVDQSVYDTVTAGLYKQKEQANGYFIMVVLSIITMFLSQFVMQKMQKAQLELQSVDGQAAMTQKMMMWIMPVMFGFFAFSYSTAFSIYMTVSSVLSTVSSVLINVLIEKNISVGKAAKAATGRSKKEINRIEKEKAAAEEEAKAKELEKEQKKNLKKKKENE
ncbi:MAG: YidC/Oxa1 family membrane protein insertase [Clostridia bacterium]|nr:YidC/Oxa1 family membrane protein insertase [Clostridia bacterium]